MTIATEAFLPNDWRASTSMRVVGPPRRIPAKLRFLTTLAARTITPRTTPIERMSRPRSPINVSPAALLARCVGAADDLCDPHAELVVDDDDLAAGDEGAVHQEVDGAAGHPVELDDRAGGEGEQVAHGHAGAPELGGDAHLDVGQQLQRCRIGGGGATGAVLAAEVGELHRGGGVVARIAVDVDGHREDGGQR